MNRWLENQSQLALISARLWFVCALRCRVSLITETGVELSTADGGRITVELSDPDMEFKYAEPREFYHLAATLTESQRLAPSLMILLPDRGHDDSHDDEQSPPETIYFAEIVGDGPLQI